MRKLFREINPGENKEDYLDYIKSICRIVKDKNGKKYRRYYGSGSNIYARLVWNIHHPENQVSKGDGFDIDHRDGDSMNDNISNYIKRTRGNHISRHHKGKIVSPETKAKIREFHEGQTHTPETRRKLSAAKKGNTNSAKYVMVEYQIFETRKRAAQVFGVSSTTIRRWILKNKLGCMYI